jgi:hypothetical protein
LSTARLLELTPEEITLLQTKQPLTTLLRNKIIQQGVDRTQYVTTPAQRQGLLTQHPVLRELLAYQSYSSGTARFALDTFKNLSEGLGVIKKGGSPEQFLRGVFGRRGLLKTLAIYTGVGVLTVALRRAVTQTQPPDDDTLLDRAVGGFVETAFLGLATRLLWNSGSSDPSIERAMVAAMPKLNAALSIVSAGYNAIAQQTGWPTKGRYGEFPIAEQAYQVGKKNISAYRAAANQFERWMYPEEQDWRDGRKLSRKFNEANGRIQKGGEFQINPEYYPIRRALQRSDIGAMQDEFSKFISTHAGDPKGLREVISNLRASLLQDRPMHVGREHEMQFLSTLAPEDIGRVYAADVKHRAIVDAFTKGF